MGGTAGPEVGGEKAHEAFIGGALLLTRPALAVGVLVGAAVGRDGPPRAAAHLRRRLARAALARAARRLALLEHKVGVGLALTVPRPRPTLRLAVLTAHDARGNILGLGVAVPRAHHLRDAP